MKTPEAAEEVAQDTWVAVLDGLRSFEGRSTLKTWLFRVLVNRAKTKGMREARTVAFSELERFVDQKLKNFSSGMQVRLAYSIAIQIDFDILLLDEVLAVGDQAFQEKCFGTFDQFRAEGKTIVYVSHALETVAEFCDRALLLRNGIVEAVGQAEQVVGLYHSKGSVG